ncbi:unnamed protein product [Prunus armeniaca]
MEGEEEAIAIQTLLDLINVLVIGGGKSSRSASNMSSSSSSSDSSGKILKAVCTEGGWVGGGVERGS